MGDMQSEDPIAELFRRIDAGEATEEEITLAARWLSRLDVKPQRIAPNEVAARRLRMHQAVVARNTASKRPRRIFRGLGWISAAAVLLLSLALWQQQIDRDRTSGPVRYQVVHTTRAQQKRLVLPDGTVVLLNPVSTLRVPSNFGQTGRDVHLEGRAFFDVARDASRPFTIESADLSVNVLGTSFSVSSYGDDAEAEVMVESGKVQVTAPGQMDHPQILGAGDQLVYDKKLQEMRRQRVHPEDYQIWRRGELVFKDAPLQTICRGLQRRYDVEITIESPSIADRRLSIEPRGEPIDRIMYSLSVAGGFRYRIQGKKISIHE
ncbi:FecR family protein [Parapedobacter sp. GCM10030251]|uniref:FecR family protein n=1 Tax=Parapedobacter sp. GCM10030251 TaxID=3273419 RepID=UPI0036104C71